MLVETGRFFAWACAWLMIIRPHESAHVFNLFLGMSLRKDWRKESTFSFSFKCAGMSKEAMH